MDPTTLDNLEIMLQVQYTTIRSGFQANLRTPLKHVFIETLIEEQVARNSIS